MTLHEKQMENFRAAVKFQNSIRAKAKRRFDKIFSAEDLNGLTAKSDYSGICFEKINRFDPRKGKAFNYMTTCILNHFRQLYRSARNYNELKKRYHSFLSDKFETIVIRNGKEMTFSEKSY